MALSANTQREKQTTRPSEVLVVPVNAGSHIFAGGIVMREAASSVFVPGADTSGCVFAGVALEELDNTNGADGTCDGLVAARAIRVERSGVYEFALNGSTPKPFATAYVYDDTTVTAAVGNGVKAGIFLRLGPNGGWLVDTSFAHAADPLGDPITAIVAASEAHALNSTFSDTEVDGALDALGAKVNLIIAALVAKGILIAEA